MFNNRKNKTFNYNPRFHKDEVKDVDLAEKTKTEVGSQWKRTRKTGAGKRKIGLPGLLLLLGIIIAIMFYLESKL
ncbi:hypothetical protein CLV86_1562 [Lacinutrix venerupis]|uniref:Uncharacterized protein n=1 Tax=Lacinutrix venerupis TaxID=1486034 RepID=A0AAC9LPF9_9FLAO|nr:hypothetical protein [Lacinutrix venerupis]APY00793.1 hypothetical protein BWR22_10870 [Lacinutrix venerupis]RLJ64442.1 hypothetical protein CLV86_1562 [Lacinutrix venerupis]